MNKFFWTFYVFASKIESTLQKQQDKHGNLCPQEQARETLQVSELKSNKNTAPNLRLHVLTNQNRTHIPYIEIKIVNLTTNNVHLFNV